MLTTGDYVLYGGVGVCEIAAFETQSFDGKNTDEYCKLVPLFGSSLEYYLPSSILESTVRGLLSKNEILNVINNMPKTDSLKITDSRAKKHTFNLILKSGDYSRIVPMIKMLHDEKQARLSNGRRLTFSDEKAMHDAEELMCQEFSVVLDIDKSAVPQYIENTLRASAAS